jgi:hypothetical protein
MQVLVERECERRRILERCAIAEANFERGPMFWLTQHTRTEDTQSIFSQDCSCFPEKEQPFFCLLSEEYNQHCV